MIKRILKSVLPPPIHQRLKRVFYRPTPMQWVMRQLEKRNLDLRSMDALEVFGRDGHWHTQYYAPLIRSLEVWEIQDKYREVLHKNFPAAKVKITDSFQEIKQTLSKYDLVVVDNSMGIFVDDPYHGSTPTTYCEHFDLFPAIFRVLKDEAVIIVNVIPATNEAAMGKYPLLFDSVQLSRRAKFYQTDHPDNISLDDMREAYRRIMAENGFKLDWSVSRNRGGAGVVYYLAMKSRHN